MTDNFNPYAEWLGLVASTTPPNHYQLLGIDESVTGASEIASAADQAMTRVRACKPGLNAAAWAQLLDQISAAKTTLTDPAQRRSYDQLLAAPTPATAAPVNPNLLPPTPAVQVPVPAPTIVAQPATPQQSAPQTIDPMAPVAATPIPVAAQMVQPTPVATVPQAVPYLQAASPATAAPNPMAPIAQAMQGVPIALPVPQAATNPMSPTGQLAPVDQAMPVAPSPIAPMQPAGVPVAAQTPTQVAPIAAQPTASPMLAARPVPPAQSEAPIDAPALKRKQSATARAHSNSGGLLGPILLGGTVGGLILVVVGVGFYLAGSKPDPDPEPIAVVSTTKGDRVSSTIPRRLDEIPESERPRPDTYIPPTPPPVTPTPEPMVEPTPSVTPAPTPPEPTTPSPEPMVEAKPSRKELRALSRALTTARVAIGELNFSVADDEISKALELAKLDEHKAKIVRLQLLSDYVNRFTAAIEATLGRVNAGDQIPIGDKTFGIVEVSPELLIIRYGGRNLRYPLSELPPGLATRLAEMSLDATAPETVAMKAAFVSINPKIGDDELEKVRTWWEEAASVSNVQDLITAINDDYSLKQDMMVKPLEPNAMAELTARADRLKDATTIEDFAKEFQAAIDESLKTLEADLELSVGGSTIVKIKELKSDRVMLTIAEETRGYQLTKLPLGLAASIAERILPRDTPLTMVMKGAYFAARDKDQPNKQFRPIVFEWWKQAAQMDQQMQPVISELAKQYPE
ncbi:MAG: hypothetical protein H8E66_02325 [Planctomycetes bacterium]|nr:hypothetical protein [Planctomycetota bacterium]